MASMRTGPCDWPIDYTTCPSCKPLDDFDADEEDDGKSRLLFETMAGDYLWRWSGKMFGLCEKTVRPCRPYPQGGSSFTGSGAPWTPVIIEGDWVNLTCGSCYSNSCDCEEVDAIVLPGPIHEIETVTIDGKVLAPENYRVIGLDRLSRTDGGEWPRYQNMNALSGEDGSFVVVYTSGIAVPAGGQVAAGILACEFAKASCNDSSCALPKRLQSITRQGVSMAILDNFDDLDSGYTGIWLIDSWLASVTKTPRRSRVYSPDVPRRFSVR